MVARINTVSFFGVEVQNVDVQVQISGGLPAFMIVGYKNHQSLRRLVLRLSLCLTLAFTLLLPLPLVALAQDLQKPVDYAWISKRAHGLAAMSVQGGITVFGSNLYLRFDDKNNRAEGYTEPVGARLSGPFEFDGYVQFVQSLSETEVIIAGVNHKAGAMSSLFTKDSRRNFIAKINLEKVRLEPQEYLTLKDRVSYGLALNDNNQIVLLSGSHRGGYALTVFNSDLREIHSTRFGVGGNGDVAVTADGNYAAIGFDVTEDGKGRQPVYWELSPDLQLVERRVLSEELKDVAVSSALMKLLVNGNNIYAVYGWSNCPGCKKPELTKLWIEKLQKDGNGWKQTYPYNHHAKFYIAANGKPFVLEPKKDAIHQTIFDENSGDVRIALLERPNTPLECFPPNLYYEIIDILPLATGETHIVLTSRPLDSPSAGCVAIGKVNL